MTLMRGGAGGGGLKTGGQRSAKKLRVSFEWPTISVKELTTKSFIGLAPEL